MGNKNVIIIGASSGLGAGMAREFARRGHDLGLCARRLERLESLKAELQAAHPGIRIEIRTLDVTDHAQVFDVVRGFNASFGHLDRVVVNAGVGQGMPVGKGGFERNKAIIETNLIAALAQCEAAMEIFRAQDRGHLAVIASVSAIRGFRGGLTAYAASKAGIIGLTKSVAKELGSRNIRCNAIAPGFVETDMTHYLNEGDGAAKYLADIPLGRFAKPEDIANVALFLASELGSYLTGQVISACGGLNI